MPYQRPRIISVSNRTFRIAHPEFPGQPKTYTTASSAAGATSLTVQDNTGLANADFIRIGKEGTERSEIVRISAVVTRGTALTVTTTVFAHGAGVEVERIQFNQWRLYGETTSTFAATNLIDTVDIQVDAPYTTYINTGTEYAWYFVRGYNSNTATNSDQESDGIQRTVGHAILSVGSIIQKALRASKTKIGGDITSEFLYDEINDCLAYVNGKLKRWSALQNFGFVLGQTARGRFTYSMPSDIADPNTNKSILEVKVANEFTLDYIDEREGGEKVVPLKLTSVRTAANAGDTTLAIENSYDFGSSGSVNVYISNTSYTITYTGVTRSATLGVLTGIPATGTGSITVTIPVDTSVYQDEEEGKPKYYTASDGEISIWPLPSADYINFNLLLSYFTNRTTVDSDSDVVEWRRYDMVKHWLTWKLRSMNNASGQLDMNDGDLIMFNAILKDTISKEAHGQRYRMKPQYNQISYG